MCVLLSPGSSQAGLAASSRPRDLRGFAGLELSPHGEIGSWNLPFKVAFERCAWLSRDHDGIYALVSLGDLEGHLEMNLDQLARSRVHGSQAGCVSHCSALSSVLLEPLLGSNPLTIPGLKHEVVLSG